MLEAIKESRNQIAIESSQDEKKDQEIRRSALQSSQQHNTILHVLTTGTPYVIKPGKSQPDYIHQWTKGEKILARLVDKIGMEKFHRVPKDGETKLAGRLIDVKPSDFEFILTHGKNDENEDKENQQAATSPSPTSSPAKEKSNAKNWRDDCLMEELSWIANNILRMLIIDNRPKIGCSKILFPLDPRFEHVSHDEMLPFIEGIFKKEWAQKEGPLKGADVEVIIVNTE